MSIADYMPKTGAQDFFEAEEQDHFCFPCCVCEHRYHSDHEQPCCWCCHNATATEGGK